MAIDIPTLTVTLPPKQPDALPPKELPDDDWYRHHLRGLVTVPESSNGTTNRDFSLMFMQDYMRPDVKELLTSEESELVHRVWVEDAYDREGRQNGYYLWWTGLLQHDGGLPATPTMMGKYFSPEDGQILSDTYNQAENQPQQTYETLKSIAQEEMLQFFIDQPLTYQGQKTSQFSDSLSTPSDQAAHLFIHGWTGNHLEFKKHIESIIQGIHRRKDDPNWIQKISSLFDSSLPDINGTAAVKNSKGELLDALQQHPGQRDPQNHLFLAFGTMCAAGTSPEEIGAVKNQQVPDLPLNNYVSVDSIVEQPVFALEEFANTLGKLWIERRIAVGDNWDSPPIRELIRNNAARVLQKINHVWGHSMGGHVVLRNLQKGIHSLADLFTKVGNNDCSFYALNAESYGTITPEVKAEIKRYREKSPPMSIKFLNPFTPLGLTAKYGHAIMRPKIIWNANKEIGISQALTRFLLNDIESPVMLSAHQDNNLHGPAQVAVNTRLCEQMPFFIRDDLHYQELQKMAANGHLIICNGTENPGDRILSSKSVKIQEELIGPTSIIETNDHAISPEKLEDIVPIIYSPRRGSLGSPIGPFEMLQGLIPDQDIHKYVKITR